jgi:hypothetical protein
MKNSSPTPTTPAEHQVVELRKEGKTLKEIKDLTDVPDRRITALIKDIVKGKKPSQRVPKIPTPLNRATDRVFQLARRGCGIRDYELRNILHEEYGTTKDTSTNSYESNYNSDTITRVKAKVRQRAVEEDCSVIFTMDWIDECAPRSSSNFLTSAATDLLSRIEEYVTEYMAMHGSRQTDNSEAAGLARKKQRYAVERHLLKLAITGYSPEPIEKLLERTATLVGVLEGNPDQPIAASTTAISLSTTQDSQVGHPLDYAEREGWLI